MNGGGVHKKSRGSRGSIFRSFLNQGTSPSPCFESTCHDALTKSLGLEKVLAYEKASDISDEEFGISGCASCLKYSDDGASVAVAGPDCRVVVYDAMSADVQYSVEGHSEIVTGVAWVNSSSSRRSLYTASLDKTIRLWNGKESVAVYMDHYDWIRSLGISRDDKTLVSGCVSSNIFIRDTETGKTKCRTHAMCGLDEKLGKLSGSLGSLCTSFEYSVNSIDFFGSNPNIFVSGVRDGTVRMWDTRDIGGGAVATLYAHEKKLNQVQMGQGDSALLTSGRDSVIRLWDTRMLSHVPEPRFGKKRSLLMEFHDHKCHSYNISCTFLSNDRAVATGSEDKKVWVYDAKTGGVLKTLEGHGSVVHFLATPRSQCHNLQLASSSIDSNEVNIWSARYKATEPCTDECVEEEEDDAFNCFRRMSSLESTIGVSRRTSLDSRGEGVGTTSGSQDHLSLEEFDSSNEDEVMIDAQQLAANQMNNNLMEMHRLAIESLMQKHGDLILRIFHACDYSFRTHIDWRSLVRHLTTQMNPGLGQRGAVGGSEFGANLGEEEGSHVSGFDPESVAEAVMEMATIFSNITEEQNNLNNLNNIGEGGQ